MVSQSTKKPDPGAEPEGDAPANVPAPAVEDAKPRVARYVDGTPRTYHWPDGPQTAEFGDVCALPEGLEVDDGRWEPSKAIITRLRDNHPDQFAITSARQAEARRKAHEEAAKAAEGGEQR